MKVPIICYILIVICMSNDNIIKKFENISFVDALSVNYNLVSNISDFEPPNGIKQVFLETRHGIDDQEKNKRRLAHHKGNKGSAKKLNVVENKIKEDFKLKTYRGSNHEKESQQMNDKKAITRCGGFDHSSLTRPCSQNDTYCGEWIGRYWHPSNCYYQNITSEQARKCLGKRTLAFIGDSQVRDLGFGVARFLSGVELLDAHNYKVGGDFDSSKYNIDLNSLSIRIPKFSHWQYNAEGPHYNDNGFILPTPHKAKEHNYQWQVQLWTLYRNDLLYDQAAEVLSNSMLQHLKYLQPIDLSFWSHGLHDYGWFNTAPYGDKFYKQVLRVWRDSRRQTRSVPSVWVSLNSECTEKLRVYVSKLPNQANVIDEANWYSNNKLAETKMPYWDAGAALRSPQRCNISDDGVHVKMFVDIMRAKMLFNHLCDENMTWRGSDNMFK